MAALNATDERTTPFPPGEKQDAGKEPVRLVLHLMPRAVLAIAKVAAYGAEKYTEDGWLQVPNGINRYTDAMFRHALREGIEQRDEESGLLHAAQTAWNALARLELMLRQSSDDLDDHFHGGTEMVGSDNSPEDHVRDAANMMDEVCSKERAHATFGGLKQQAKDAARYRFLCAFSEEKLKHVPAEDNFCIYIPAWQGRWENVHAAVDAAMAGQVLP